MLRDAVNLFSLESATETQRNEATEVNLITHMSWAQRHTAGMWVEVDTTLTCVDSGLPTDTFNVICGAHLPEEEIEERIASAVGHFHVVQRPFSWWLGPADRPLHLGQALEAAGLTAAEVETAMIVDLAALQNRDMAPPGLRIDRARTPEQIGDFAQVIAANWSPPDTAVLAFYTKVTPVLLRPDAPLQLYVAYLDDTAVACAELTLGGGVAGLYSICTLEAYRLRGIGSALTLRLLLDARKQGYRGAVLQASEAGLRLYARLGFTVTGKYVEYKLT